MVATLRGPCRRSIVVYVQPSDLPHTHIGVPLWDIVPQLGIIARRSGADILLTDSILAGMNVGEERLKSDAQAPYLYVRALDALRIPAVSTGHTSRATPEGEPYGSVSWVNAMRLTWLGTPAEGEGHRVRWRPRKRNERGAIPGILLHFSYADGRTLSSVERTDDELNTRGWILLALSNGQEKTVDALADELLEASEESTSASKEAAKERIRKTLNRMRKELIVTKTKEGRNAPWRLVREETVSRKDFL